MTTFFIIQKVLFMHFNVDQKKISQETDSGS